MTTTGTGDRGGVGVRRRVGRSPDDYVREDDDEDDDEEQEEDDDDDNSSIPLLGQ
ncbi:MAG: hypothetical protein GY813_04470 [Halieaceae bacterium]|nr:hypothetical protein [Halieaceae bacterium]